MRGRSSTGNSESRGRFRLGAATDAGMLDDGGLRYPTFRDVRASKRVAPLAAIRAWNLVPSGKPQLSIATHAARVLVVATGLSLSSPAHGDAPFAGCSPSFEGLAQKMIVRMREAHTSPLG